MDAKDETRAFQDWSRKLDNIFFVQNSCASRLQPRSARQLMFPGSRIQFPTNLCRAVLSARRLLPQAVVMISSVSVETVRNRWTTTQQPPLHKENYCLLVPTQKCTKGVLLGAQKSVYNDFRILNNLSWQTNYGFQVCWNSFWRFRDEIETFLLYCEAPPFYFQTVGTDNLLTSQLFTIKDDRSA